MSLATLAKRDALDPWRSRSLWVLLGVFALVFGLLGYLIGDSNQAPALVFGTVFALLGPLAALAFGYDAIAGPRENGALRVLLSYPYSRREVVLGTLAGRVAVVSLAVVVAILVGTFVTIVVGGPIDPVSLAIVLALSLALTITIVGVAVGISASVATSNRAAIVAFGAFLLFSSFWGLVPTAVRYVLSVFSTPAQGTPEWVLWWNQLNPFAAFRTAMQGLLEAPASEALYHTPWFAGLVLVGWFVLPVLAGITSFERADL